MNLLPKTSLCFTLALLALLPGCMKASPNAIQTTKTAPVVSNVQVHDLGVKPGVDGATNAIEATITLRKDSLNQEFLYGADLQHSSLFDKEMDLYTQSLAIGHVPANFRIMGEELQLVANDSRLYPSDSNHPEHLISRYKILSQTELTITVSGADSGVYLAQVFGATSGDSESLTNPASPPPRELWIRSVDFDANGNYLLQQTSVMLADGSIAEFMESLFPRVNLRPGQNFRTFPMNPDSKTGGDEGLLSRYMFLQGEQIFHGEQKLSMGQHPDLSPASDGTAATLNWYVTPNIPDEDLLPVQRAVEGWNRYFLRMQGFKRPVMKFMGRLPKGIYLGDPRYNVISWDSRQVAGAAYESQATDPETGKQSHSLIYMPAAWLSIGTSYWQNGVATDPDHSSLSVSPAALARHGGAVHRAKLACFRSLKEDAGIASSGRVPAIEIKNFGQELLKQTLFHEVGHSLGLAHNFEGSLSFDRSKPESLFSTSIMDYNNFEIERQAFSGIDTFDGPLLEYDRQAISVLFNQGADVSADAPVVPSCNDAVADNEEDGVNPLCIRYDIEHDPTLSVDTALARINEATLPRDITLTQAIAKIPELVLTADALQSVKTEDDFTAMTAKLGNGLVGPVKFYIVTSSASLNRTVRLNTKSLLEFGGVLPNGYDELMMRERAFNGVQKAVGFTSLPLAVSTALAAATDSAISLMGQTPYIKSLNKGGAQDALAQMKKTLSSTVADFSTDKANGLPKLRSAVLASLVNHENSEYFFGKLGKTSLDYETGITGILSDVSLDKTRSDEERAAAVTALQTYAGQGNLRAEAVIKSVITHLSAELDAATDNDSREIAEALLKTLTVAKAPPHSDEG